MFCKNCGSKLEDDAVFCPNCGVHTDRQTTTPAQPRYDTAPQPAYYAPPSNSNTVGLVGFILSFLVPLAGLICSILGFVRAKNENLNYKGLSLAGIIISAAMMVVNFFLSRYLYNLLLENYYVLSTLV